MTGQFNLIRKHVLLNGVALSLKRGYFEGDTPPKEKHPKSGGLFTVETTLFTDVLYLELDN
jgi:hypothetical protein